MFFTRPTWTCQIDWDPPMKARAFDRINDSIKIRDMLTEDRIERVVEILPPEWKEEHLE